MPILVVKRLVLPGHEKDYEQSIDNLITHAEKMKGYMGINIVKPSSKSHPLYVFTAKFDTKEHLNIFKESAERKECLRELQKVSQGPMRERIIDKLDWWFALPGTHYDIPRYKMVIITTLSAYPVVLAINLLIDSKQDVGMLLMRTLIVVAVTISAISYITMPIFLHVFQRWLAVSDETFIKK